MLILGIDTSCDETSVALVENGVAVRGNVVRSQQGLHEEHGGIVPEAASRAHLGAIVPAVREVLEAAPVGPDAVTAIAVTCGPGLGGSLMVGLQAAKGMAYGWGKPLLPINHLEGHIYSAWPAAHAAGRSLPLFPVLTLIVSGGHTELILMRDHTTYERLGGTRDDAAGEAFDKVGRLLGLPYPGGPAIERAAQEHLAVGGAPHPLPQALLRGTWDFSFSGVKTAVLHMVDPSTVGRRHHAPDQPTAQTPAVGALAAGFQDSVVGVLVAKTVDAARQMAAASVIVAGGVASNGALRRAMAAALQSWNIPLYVPPPALCTDNAAMIAAAGYFRLVARGVPGADTLRTDVVPGLTLTGMKS